MLHGGDGACSGVAGHCSLLLPAAELHRSRSPNSSSVDCTLSLGTPSTRHTSTGGGSTASPVKGSCFQVFGSWDAISHFGKPSAGSSLGGEQVLLSRRCANCDTTSTPLWRNGPRGPKSLCNACGIRHKKEERRAAAATTTTTLHATAPPQQAWNCYTMPAVAAPAKSPSISMSFSGEEDDGEASYLSWRLNVVRSPSQFPASGLLRYQ